MHLCFILAFTLSAVSWAQSYKAIEALEAHTPVYSEPSDTAAAVAQIRPGAVLKCSEEKNGFYGVRSKAGKMMWIRMAQAKVVLPDATDGDLEKVEHPRAVKPVTYPRFTFDISGAAGASSVGSFYEIQGGVNVFFNEWLVLRNAPFYRFFGANSAFGWDVSARAQTALSIPVVTPTLMGGLGYRFMTLGGNAPFAEAGLTILAGQVRLAVGGKLIFYDLIYPGTAAQFLYTFGVSGGGSF